MKSPYSNSKPQGNVNDKLHTLRGEQFRHSQNLLQSRSHIVSSRSAINRTATTGTLPEDYMIYIPSPSFSFFAVDEDVPFTKDLPVLHPQRNAPSKISAPPTWSGPSPPKSWVLTKSKDVHDTPEWRAKATSLVLSPSISHLHSQVPPLTLLCLRALRALSASEFVTEIVPYLPQHLRCQLLRDSAVHSPLQDSQLYALLGSDGHADGEIIIVGPYANIHEGHFGQITSHTDMISDDADEQLDWESPLHDAATEPLHKLVLLSTRLTVLTMLTLPPTLTHLALLHLPSPVPVHRLPPLCPLLMVLDLSYNEWLGYHPPEQADRRNTEGIQMLARVDWGRWQSLKVLGLRGCLSSGDLIQKVNKGRWDDVQIVR